MEHPHINSPRASHAVEEYKRDGLLDYPGRRVEGSFVTDGAEVLLIPGEGAKAIEAIDKYLESQGLPLIDERIPVLAYGANASPGMLKGKFEKYDVSGTEVSRAEIQTIPCVNGVLSGSDVVWHGRPGQSGGYFSELYGGEEVADTEVKVAVQFLTPEQLAVLHTTEGGTYGVAEIKGVHLGDDIVIDAVAYVAREASMLLDEKGQPVSVAGIERSSVERQTWTARQALEYTLGLGAVQSAIGALTAEDYQASLVGKKLSEKKAVQATVQNGLEAEGASRSMRHYAIDGAMFGRANFSNLPRGTHPRPHETGPVHVELMETSTGRVRPSREERERRLKEIQVSHPGKSIGLGRRSIDPAEVIRMQATAELNDPDRVMALREATKKSQRTQQANGKIENKKER